MRIINCAQGSPEWHGARAGAITASMFWLTRESEKLKRGPNEGDYKAAALDYAFKLAIERISGQPLQDDQFETYAMRRGHELEPEARAEHEVMAGVLVERAGFVTTDDGLFGASVDGLLGDKGACEYKCFVSPEKLRTILLTGDLSDCMDQMQGGIWITGVDYFHFGLYCPALRCVGQQFTLEVVQRDDDFIYKLEQDLIAFNRVVVDFEAQLRARAAERISQA
jgi:hypothetical protein